jgi:hypothetical protein
MKPMKAPQSKCNQRSNKVINESNKQLSGLLT